MNNNGDILIVDDNDDFSSALAMLLELESYQVRSVTTARQALEAAPRFEPDFVLVDLGLPDMDGCDLVEQLKGQSALAEASFVAVTGRDGREDYERTKRAGFDRHYVKTQPVDDLLEMLEAL